MKRCEERLGDRIVIDQAPEPVLLNYECNSCFIFKMKSCQNIAVPFRIHNDPTPMACRWHLKQGPDDDCPQLCIPGRASGRQDHLKEKRGKCILQPQLALPAPNKTGGHGRRGCARTIISDDKRATLADQPWLDVEGNWPESLCGVNIKYLKIGKYSKT